MNESTDESVPSELPLHREVLGWIKERWAEKSTRVGLATNLIALSGFTPYPYSWWMLFAAMVLGGQLIAKRDDA